MIRCSLHNHTNFCDGVNTPREMTDAAYAMGCRTFGISEHSPFPYEKKAGMLLEDLDHYEQQMQACKKAYEGRMEVLWGIEQDIFSPPLDRSYDYVIGSVHYVLHDGAYCTVDYTDKEVQRVIRDVYAGDALALAEEYFQTVSRVADVTNCDIIGHFDLVTKFNEADRLFDTGSIRYRNAAMQALEELLSKKRIFEINSGAIARGYRKKPYPQDWILKEIRAHKGQIMLSSDAHQKENILFAFDRTAALAKSCGFETVMVYENGAWREKPLEEA